MCLACDQPGGPARCPKEAYDRALSAQKALTDADRELQQQLINYERASEAYETLAERYGEDHHLTEAAAEQEQQVATQYEDAETRQEQAEGAYAEAYAEARDVFSEAGEAFPSSELTDRRAANTARATQDDAAWQRSKQEWSDKQRKDEKARADAAQQDEQRKAQERAKLAELRRQREQEKKQDEKRRSLEQEAERQKEEAHTRRVAEGLDYLLPEEQRQRLLTQSEQRNAALQEEREQSAARHPYLPNNSPSPSGANAVMELCSEMRYDDIASAEIETDWIRLEEYPPVISEARANITEATAHLEAQKQASARSGEQLIKHLDTQHPANFTVDKTEILNEVRSPGQAADRHRAQVFKHFGAQAKYDQALDTFDISRATTRFPTRESYRQAVTAVKDFNEAKRLHTYVASALSGHSSVDGEFSRLARTFRDDAEVVPLLERKQRVARLRHAFLVDQEVYLKYSEARQ